MTRTRGTFAAVGLLALGIQVVRPARTNPPTHPDEALTAQPGAGASAAAILDRACRDCHSNDTRWPWYSHVAPVSWWVIEHVNHGRSHFNYSQWARYDPDRQSTLLERTCSLAKAHDMPLGSYRLVHSSARLTDADVDVLCRWTRTVRR